MEVQKLWKDPNYNLVGDTDICMSANNWLICFSFWLFWPPSKWYCGIKLYLIRKSEYSAIRISNEIETGIIRNCIRLKFFRLNLYGPPCTYKASERKFQTREPSFAMYFFDYCWVAVAVGFNFLLGLSMCASAVTKRWYLLRSRV